MKSLKQMVGGMVRKVLSASIPTQRVTTVDTRQEPPSIATQMDPGRIMAIMAAAESGNTRDLFALYRDVVVADSHLQAEFTKRKLAVLGDVMTFRPVDKNNAADTSSAELVKNALTKCPGWRRSCSHLLDSSLYPVSLVEKVYRPTSTGYALAALHPVPYQLLDFSAGRLMLYNVAPDTGVILGTKHEADPARYIIHRGNLLSAPDNWGGPMRSILFWWLLGAMSRDWWTRFLDRYGSPFLVGKFADDEGKSILERAFSLSTRLGGLVTSEDTSVEIKQAAAQDSGSAYEKFLSICQREKSKLILGQTLSSDAQATGLGSGTADMQEGVRQDIRKFDAAMLTETLQDQLIAQFSNINGIAGNKPMLIWGADSSDEIRVMGSMFGSLANIGLEPSDDAIPIISDKVGFGLQRKAAAPAAPAPFSASWRGNYITDRRHAAASRIVMGSRSQGEAIERLSAQFPELDAGRIQMLIAELITDQK